MIQQQTILKVSDNSGAKSAKCIKVLGGFKKQFAKETNFGLGIYDNQKMISFIIGDLIKIKNIIEYEIFIVYVSKNKRKLGYASNLLQCIPLNINKEIKKIYLEVSSENKQAIKLYEKNGYKKSGMRKNYYKVNSQKFNSYLFEKIINE